TPATGIVLYTFDRRHSPITSGVVQRLLAIAAQGRGAHDDVFAKVGDSITAMPEFATCFASGAYDLAAHTALAPTLDYYLQGNAGGTSPYARTSQAAYGGWTAADLLAGSPAPVDAEVAAIAPRVALVLIGTNDNRYARPLSAFGTDLWTVVDRLIGDGVVPALSTMPPIHSDPTTDARVAVFDLVVRAIAQGRQVPLVDLYRELVPLPNEGIGGDGIHPSVAPDGPCDFQPADLQYGFDVRNLIELEQLDRVRAALAGTASDASAPSRVGSGRASDPVLASLPLADLADSRDGDPAFAFAACPPAGGARQIVYQLQLASPATIDAYAFTHAGDAAIHVLAGAPAESACIAGGQGEVTASLPAGTSYLVAGGTGEIVVAALAR
ncbi:MAG: SGNH/GDSL hydrolase family protein, partial [Acidobacteriota bacterium]